MDPIFVVTTVGLLGTKNCERTVGWYSTLEDAKYIIVHNLGDIHETCYEYALIEGIPSGLYPNILKETWFQWQDNKYVEVPKPDKFRCICNWGIG